MSIESTADWDGLRAVSSVASRTLDLLERHVRPGVTTGELDALAAQFLTAQRAQSAPAMVYGFPGTLLISIWSSPSSRWSRPAQAGRSKTATAGRFGRATVVGRLTTKTRS